MRELAILLQAMKLYSHNAHNLVERALFFQDHDFLGEVYPVYEGDYDAVVERIIGLSDGPINLIEVAEHAVAIVKRLPLRETENSSYFRNLEEMEKALREHVAAINNTASIGTQQLIGDIADRSEQRSYKLKQRIKK